MCLIKVVIEEWGVEIFNERTKNKEMCVLPGIISTVIKRVMEAVKKFLKNGWSIRKCATADRNENWREFPWNYT